MTGELVLTRQRDLLDRGLIDVLTRNDSDEELVITDRELVARSFDGGPGEPRPTVWQARPRAPRE